MALEYGVVAGRYRSTIADTPDDADDLPQLEPLVGTIIFDPRPEVILVDGTAAEGSMTITPMPTRVQLGANGDLSHNGKPYVKLLSPESSSIDTHDWTYEVSFDLRTLDGQPVRMNSFDIFVKATHTTARPLDLTTATPVIRNTGTQTIIGPSNVLKIGKVVSGAEAQAIITGTSPEQTLDLVLPTGATGATPRISIGTVETVANPADAAWIAQLILAGGPVMTDALRAVLPATMKGDKGDAGGWGTGTTIDPSTHLDTIRTPGHYSNSSTATAALGYPLDGVAGFLNVYMIAKQGHLIYQEWTPNAHTRPVHEWARGTYRRMLNSATWSPWRYTPTQAVTIGSDGFRTFSTYDPGSNLEIATSGPGGLTTGQTLPIGMDLNTVLTPGIYQQPNSNTPVTAGLNYPPMVSISGSVRGVLMVRTWNGANNTAIQEYTTIGTGANNAVDTTRPGVTYQRHYYNGFWSSWSATTSQRVDNTAGRAIYTWDDVANREQLIYGDTGWRNITSLIPTWVKGFVLHRRTTWQAEFVFEAAEFSDPIGTAIPMNVPGSHSVLTGTTKVPSAASGLEDHRFEWNWDSNHRVVKTTNSGLRGYVSFPCRSTWPTTLVGTPHA